MFTSREGLMRVIFTKPQKARKANELKHVGSEGKNMPSFTLLEKARGMLLTQPTNHKGKRAKRYKVQIHPHTL